MAASIAKKDNVYVGEIDVQLLRKQLKNLFTVSRVLIVFWVFLR